MRVHGMALKWHDCKLCDYRGKEKSDLSRHCLIEHGPRTKSCVTVGCDFKARTDKELARHKKEIHEKPVAKDDERWWPCVLPECTFCAPDENTLERHLIYFHNMQ